MSSELPIVTSDETMNALYAGERIDGSMIGAPRFARLYPPTRERIRRAILETVERHEELRIVRPEVRAFARRQFGMTSALKLLAIIAQAAGCERPVPVGHATLSTTQ